MSCPRGGDCVKLGHLRAISTVVAHFLHTEGVNSSSLLSPIHLQSNDNKGLSFVTRKPFLLEIPIFTLVKHLVRIALTIWKTS